MIIIIDFQIYDFCEKSLPYVIKNIDKQASRYTEVLYLTFFFHSLFLFFFLFTFFQGYVESFGYQAEWLLG